VLGHSFLSQTFRFAPLFARADARGEGERIARTAPELGHICASRKRLIAKTLCDMTGQILEILGNSTMSSNRQPRMQHYHFAHYALPEIIFNNLEHVVTTFSNPNANALLAELWPESRLEDSSEPPIVPAGLGVSRHDFPPDAIIFLFAFPQPTNLTEAFFTALAYWSHSSRPHFRYFTLELGFNDSGTPRTVIGEWTPDRTHLNYGDGPEPTAEAFLKRIASFLPRHVA
jgi:hypothetical protein